MARLHEVPGCRVLSIEDGPEAGVVMHVRGCRCAGRCPDCCTLSTARHGSYQRHPVDLPSLGRAVQLDLTVRRLRCLNPSCPRAFCSPASSLLAPHARRTRRVAKAQQRVGLAINARAGARLLANLSMPASASTLLRLMHAAPLPRVARARAIGVDDWAWRRGRAWGTLVVDLDHHRVIDLLPDRNSAAFEAWLALHTDLEIVARDRSTGYARAAQAVVPRAQQVADRWHFLLNACQMLERWLVALMPACVRFPSPPARRLPLLITPATTPSRAAAQIKLPHRSSCRAGGTTLEGRASCTGPAPPRGRRVDHGDRARDPSGTGNGAALRLHG